VAAWVGQPDGARASRRGVHELGLDLAAAGAGKAARAQPLGQFVEGGRQVLAGAVDVGFDLGGGAGVPDRDRAIRVGGNGPRAVAGPWSVYADPGDVAVRGEDQDRIGGGGALTRLDLLDRAGYGPTAALRRLLASVVFGCRLLGHRLTPSVKNSPYPVSWRGRGRFTRISHPAECVGALS